MTTDPFTTAAHAEAEGKFPPPRESAVIYPLSAVRSHSRGAFQAGAEWARDHLAAQDEAAIRSLAATTVHTGQDIVEAARIMRDVAQEPTDAPLTDAEWREFQSIPDQGYSHRAWVDQKITERLSAARAARRDEEKR